ncbi:hypothetical protein VNO77_23863 [Canavalia gladiata]|uniref:cytokinin dehydrogenase n=1 Tax=Canavalia gladiata TaxID=3824 RepID=A0AAN9QFP6_CANGL
MASYLMFSKALIVLWLSCIVVTEAGSQVWSPIQAHKELASKLFRDPMNLSIASTDYGHITHHTPFAVFAPSSIRDIANLIKFSNSLHIPFTIAQRGQGHSVNGQSMTSNGVVVNMNELNNGYRNGERIIIVSKGRIPFADVGGEQIWNDVLNASLKFGLTPLIWTDYLFLSIGGTLSNAGVGGQAFRFGPQISNVYELDVVTGKGDVVTCSAEKHSELFYAVLGGLGQFGIITRARIALGPAPTRVKWIRLFYNNFTSFSKDQEHLISFSGRNETNGTDYVEGFLLLDQPGMDLSFYPVPDQARITSLVTQYGIIYIIELAKYYDNSSQGHVDQDLKRLFQGLKFIPKFIFQKDVSYEEFLNRVHAGELLLRKQGLWDVPHPWLNLLVPRSQISDFDQIVFKGIILKQNLTAGLVLIYPMNRSKWDDKMSAVTADEDVFYGVSFLHSTGFNNFEEFLAQNQQILHVCADAGIRIKQYVPQFKTKEEWAQQFGPKWKLFQQRKDQFDPNRILSPGQGIFN